MNGYMDSIMENTKLIYVVLREDGYNGNSVEASFVDYDNAEAYIAGVNEKDQELYSIYNVELK